MMKLFSSSTEGNAASKHFDFPKLAFRQKERHPSSELMLSKREAGTVQGSDRQSLNRHLLLESTCAWKAG